MKFDTQYSSEFLCEIIGIKYVMLCKVSCLSKLFSSNCVIIFRAIKISFKKLSHFNVTSLEKNMNSCYLELSVMIIDVQPIDMFKCVESAKSSM